MLEEDERGGWGGGKSLLVKKENPLVGKIAGKEIKTEIEKRQKKTKKNPSQSLACR